MRAVRDEEPPGAALLVVGGEIGAGRAGVADENRVLGQERLQARHQPLWPDRHLVGLGQCSKRRELLGLRLRDPPARVGLRHAGSQLVDERLEGEPRVGEDRYIGAVVGAEDARIGVYVNDPRPARFGVAPAFGRHGTGAAADENDEVGGVDDAPRLGRAPVRADDADRERVVLGDAALPADRRGDRRADTFGERSEGRLRARDDDASAADEDRRRGVREEPCRIVDRVVVGSAPLGGIDPEPRVGVQRGFVEGLLLDVVGQAQMRRARPVRGHRAERGADEAGQVLGAIDHFVPLGDGPEKRPLVEAR